MNRFNEQLNKKRRELLIELYVEGLDEADGEKVATVLRFALKDAELEHLIDEVNLYYSEELGLNEFAEQAQTVRELAREHLPSAFEANEFEEKVLTFSDVARQLEAKNRIPKGEEENISLLFANNSPLPEYLSLSEIKRIVNQLKIKASEHFWSLFRKEAIFLTMRQSQQQAAFATRAKRLQKKKEKADESSKETKNK